MKKKKLKEIIEYDDKDTTTLIDRNHPQKLKDLGFDLIDEQPTKVVSIRLPNRLLNQIKAYASERDVSYTSVIKLFLSDEMEKRFSIYK